MELYKEIEKSFSYIEKLFSDDELAAFISTRIFDLYKYHFSLGLMIRNDLLHPDGSRLKELFFENGIEHSDDMSSMIIKLFHYHAAKTAGQ